MESSTAPLPDVQSPPSRGDALNLLFMSWRDSSHPEGGGSEVYVERMAAAAAAHGHHVNLFTAAHAGAARIEERDGYRVIRRGGHITVYLWAAVYYLTRRFGRPDVIVDVQNGVPFGAALYARRPGILMLVHHVHRENWPVAVGPRTARIGWWIESRFAPRLCRKTRYVTVSRSTRDELVALGVDPGRIEIVYNAVDPAEEVHDVPRSPAPSLCVLGRLVPHKRVEIALECAARLLPQFPGLTVTVVGQGWWEPRLREAAERLGIADIVEFTGWVDDRAKHAVLARSWVMAVPSVKEGWGIVVMEAAQHGVPTVAFHGAGGLAESVVDGETGLLARDTDAFHDAVRLLFTDAAVRCRLGARAVEHAAAFEWKSSMETFVGLAEQTARRPFSRSADPAEMTHCQNTEVLAWSRGDVPTTRETSTSLHP